LVLLAVDLPGNRTTVNFVLLLVGGRSLLCRGGESWWARCVRNPGLPRRLPEADLARTGVIVAVGLRTRSWRATRRPHRLERGSREGGQTFFEPGRPEERPPQGDPARSSAGGSSLHPTRSHFRDELARRGCTGVCCPRSHPPHAPERTSAARRARYEPTSWQRMLFDPGGLRRHSKTGRREFGGSRAGDPDGAPGSSSRRPARVRPYVGMETSWVCSHGRPQRLIMEASDEQRNRQPGRHDPAGRRGCGCQGFK